MSQQYHLPVKFWQNISFWVGSLIFSFLPLFLAVAPEAFPFDGISANYLMNEKYSDVLTIIFVFVCIAFFDLLDVALALRHKQIFRVIVVVAALIFLLGSFAMVVVSHTHEAVQKQKFEEAKVASRKADIGSTLPAPTIGSDQLTPEPVDPISNLTPARGQRKLGPGKLPPVALIIMFFVAGGCRVAQAALDGESNSRACLPSGGTKAS